MEQVRRQRPALIVLDLMMPVMDGFSFTENLRAVPKYSDIPIIVLTCKTLTPQEYRRLNSRVEEVLTKGGYNRADLLDMIHRLTGRTNAVELRAPLDVNP